MPDKARVTPTIQEYLEAIVNMRLEGKVVLASRLAEILHVSRPTVSATLRRMERDGLVTTKAREIALTDKGLKEALSIMRRHRLAERLLADVLHVPWHEVHDEACLFEHAISPRVDERLYEVLNHPQTCPHGNPIPNGDSLPELKGVPLSSMPEGSTAVVVRIGEEATRNSSLLELFFRSGLVPGAVVRITAVTSFAGTITLGIDAHEVTLGTEAAGAIWVTATGR